MDDHEYRPGKPLKEHVAVARRRWRSGLGAFLTVAGVAALLALLWPPVYRSAATILIEQQEIPQDLVRSTITSFADQRIELISQRVMTTANLLDIIREHGLYADDFDTEPREVIVERMREDISRDMISADVVDPRSGRPTSATIAFTVGFDSRSPELAARVANELTSLYLQENSETRREQAAEASSFLGDEAGRLSAEIAELEARLAVFKQANIDKLPELAELNLQSVDRTERDLADVQRERSLLVERKIYLESELAQLNPSRDVIASDGAMILSPRERLKSLQSQLAAMRGAYSPSHPAVVRTERMIASLEQELGITAATEPSVADELERARAERAALREQYSDFHPEAVRLDRRIVELEQALRAESAQNQGGTSPLADADNPAYVQLRAQLTAAEMELTALDAEERELEAKRAELEERLAQTPIIERDYDALTRDLDTARTRYREVRFSEQSAQTAENLEMDAKGERFTLIEPPLVPQRPVAPNRWLILFLGVLLATGAAFGLVSLREAFDTSIHGPLDVQALARAAPLGVIPNIVTREDERRQRRLRYRVAFGAAGAIVVVLALAHFFVMPIDDLWFGALRRFGV
jgi:uncharacterized protein involved in exopolysaccharide biosynthesis